MCREKGREVKLRCGSLSYYSVGARAGAYINKIASKADDDMVLEAR